MNQMDATAAKLNGWLSLDGHLPNAPLMREGSCVKVMDIGEIVVLSYPTFELTAELDASNYCADYAAWHGMCNRVEHEIGGHTQIFLSCGPL